MKRSNQTFILGRKPTRGSRYPSVIPPHPRGIAKRTHKRNFGGAQVTQVSKITRQCLWKPMTSSAVTRGFFCQILTAFAVNFFDLAVCVIGGRSEEAFTSRRSRSTRHYKIQILPIRGRLVGAAARNKADMYILVVLCQWNLIKCG